MKIFIIAILILLGISNVKGDACNVTLGNNCTCLSYGSQIFPDSKCNTTIHIVPENPNVIVIPGSCGFINWHIISGVLPSGLSLDSITGEIVGTIAINGMGGGFPVGNNPLVLGVQGDVMLYPHTFNLTYTLVFNDVCSCLNYDDGNACNGVEGCDTMDGQPIPGIPLNCSASASMCGSSVCNSTIGCVESPNLLIGTSCYTGPNGTQGVGKCAAGTYQCNTTTGIYCSGSIVPDVSEDCGFLGNGNGIDENCNGAVDEGCGGSGCILDSDCQPFVADPTDCNLGICNTTTHICSFIYSPNGTSCTTNDPCFLPSGMCDGNGFCSGVTPNLLVCEDNNACTNDNCTSHVAFTHSTPFLYMAPTCTHVNPNATCFPCSVTSDCNSHIPSGCHSWNCSLGICVEVINDSNLVGCNDNDVCNGIENCTMGMCVNGTALDCDDLDPCTADSCHKIFGCQHNVVAAAGNFCNDTSNLCNIGGTCNVLGQCVGMFAVDCSPANQCILPGICNPSSGLCDFQGYSVDGTICNTNTTINACAEESKCFSGICTPTQFKECLPQSDCEDFGTCNTVDGTCIPTFLPVGTSCDSGLFCNPNATCNATGSCVSLIERDCSYLNDQCIVGKCDNDGHLCYPAVKTPLGSSCNADNSVCTVNDTCVFGLCSPGPLLNCDDGNPCTLDSCDPILGCLNVPDNSLSCSIGSSFCNINPVCLNGTCVTTPRNCTGAFPFNPCKTTTCSDIYSQCMQTNAVNGFPVPDSLMCNGVEYCQNGHVVAGVPLICNPTNSCVVGHCVEPTGCVYSYTSSVCQDGNPCTINDMCVNGACIGGGTKDCSHLNTECRLGYCNTTLNGLCVTTGLNENGSCGGSNISNLCAAQKKCISGVCTQTDSALVCNDNDRCTFDHCNPSIGCEYIGPPADVCGLCGGNITNTSECFLDFGDEDDEDFDATYLPIILLVIMLVVFMFCCVGVTISHRYSSKEDVDFKII